LIVESAFFKLPELLTSSFDHADTFEATVVHFIALAFHMELDSRNIPRPFEHVYTEKPYPAQTKGSRRMQADLFLKLEGAIPTTGRMAHYGSREVNWIEVKAFLGSTRKSATPTKTKNVGRIFRDILRLCLLPEELQGKNRQNGRYLLMVFSNDPAKSLAFKSGRRPRLWLAEMFSEGLSEVEIDTSAERKSFHKALGPGFISTAKIQAYIRFRTLVFRPEELTPSPVFWGYLIRIIGFSITVPEATIQFEDRARDHWDSERVNSLIAVRKYVLERMSLGD
jgi:hypothetical protein